MDRFLGFIGSQVVIEMWVSRDDDNWTAKWQAFCERCAELGAVPRVG